MPIDYRNYPDNWKTEIRPAILKRANHKCERCGVENYAIGARDKHEHWHNQDDYYEMGWDEQDELFPWYFIKFIRIILTIAHIHNHDPMDCRPENLQALCQKCHITLDAPAKGRRLREANRERRDAATGQMQMFDDSLGE